MLRPHYIYLCQTSGHLLDPLPVVVQSPKHFSVVLRRACDLLEEKSQKAALLAVNRSDFLLAHDDPQEAAEHFKRRRDVFLGSRKDGSKVKSSVYMVPSLMPERVVIAFAAHQPQPMSLSRIVGEVIRTHAPVATSEGNRDARWRMLE